MAAPSLPRILLQRVHKFSPLAQDHFYKANLFDKSRWGWQCDVPSGSGQCVLQSVNLNITLLSLCASSLPTRGCICGCVSGGKKMWIFLVSWCHVTFYCSYTLKWKRIANISTLFLFLFYISTSDFIKWSFLIEFNLESVWEPLNLRGISPAPCGYHSDNGPLGPSRLLHIAWNVQGP